MTARIGAIVMAALLGLYLVFVFQYALLLIGSQNGIAKALGIALLVLPIVGAWALVSEIVFVVRGQRLVRRLGEQGGLPVDDLQRSPDSWQAWRGLGLAYDASGDRGRDRWSTRAAIRLERRR